MLRDGRRDEAVELYEQARLLRERTGNADLTSAIPDLTLKMGVRTIERERLTLLTSVAHHIAEVVNIAPHPHQPFVGMSAFAHKGGMHVAGVNADQCVLATLIDAACAGKPLLKVNTSRRSSAN